MSHIIGPAKNKKLQTALDDNFQNSKKSISDNLKKNNNEVEEVDFSSFSKSNNSFDVSLQDLLDVQKLNEQIDKRSNDVEIL